VWQVTVSFQIGKTWKSVLQKHENEVVEQNNTTLEMMLESIGKILIGIRGTCECLTQIMDFLKCILHSNPLLTCVGLLFWKLFFSS
jgi:hypothetical protein